MLKAMLGEAWHAMHCNRMRTALTMLGMVIGVGSTTGTWSHTICYWPLTGASTAN